MTVAIIQRKKKHVFWGQYLILVIVYYVQKYNPNFGYFINCKFDGH